jgi:hypothetical protein
LRDSPSSWIIDNCGVGEGDRDLLRELLRLKGDLEGDDEKLIFKGKDE